MLRSSSGTRAPAARARPATPPASSGDAGRVRSASSHAPATGGSNRQVQQQRHVGHTLNARSVTATGANAPEGRLALLAWMNRAGRADYASLEDLSDGVLYCQLLHNITVAVARAAAALPSGAPSLRGHDALTATQWAQAAGTARGLFSAIHWGSGRGGAGGSTPQQRLGNMLLLAQLMTECVPRALSIAVDAERLATGRLQEHMRFVQWLQAFHARQVARFDAKLEDAELQRRQLPVSIATQLPGELRVPADAYARRQWELEEAGGADRSGSDTAAPAPSASARLQYSPDRYIAPVHDDQPPPPSHPVASHAKNGDHRAGRETTESAAAAASEGERLLAAVVAEIEALEAHYIAELRAVQNDADQRSALLRSLEERDSLRRRLLDIEQLAREELAATLQHNIEAEEADDTEDGRSANIIEAPLAETIMEILAMHSTDLS